MSIVFTLMLMITSGLVFAAVVIGVHRLGPAWDALATHQLGTLALRADTLALDTRQLQGWLRIWGMFLVVTPLVFWLGFNMFPFGLAVTYIIYLIPKHVLDYLINRRKGVLRDQLVSATQGLANATRAGLTPFHGFVEIATETPQPLARELKRIVIDADRGQRLNDALEKTRQRLQLEPFTLFATAVKIAMERGGRLNEALDRISASLRDNQRLERKLEADTASGRRAGMILAMFPLFFLGLFRVLDADSVGLLFNTLAGQCVLIAVLALVYIGGKLSFKVMDIKA